MASSAVQSEKVSREPRKKVIVVGMSVLQSLRIALQLHFFIGIKEEERLRIKQAQEQEVSRQQRA